MALSDGLLVFESGKYVDGGNSALPRMMETQLGWLLTQRGEIMMHSVPMGRQGQTHPWVLQTLALSILTIAGQGAQASQQLEIGRAHV